MADLIMTFLNDENRKVNLRVPEADETTQGSAIASFMDTVIDKNIFTSTGGDLSEKYEAKFVTVTRTEVDVDFEEGA